MDKLSFTKMSKIISKFVKESSMAARLDAGFDAGEFSGPEHARALDETIQLALVEGGWTEGEYLSELYTRERL